MHFDWNVLIQAVLSVIASYFAGHQGASNGATKAIKQQQQDK